jgi:transcriptional regulator with XRE-family HTH domain
MDAQVPDRKALLRKRRGAISQIAAREGVTKGHVSRVAAGERRSPEIEKAIAKVLGLPVATVFPEWYRDSEVA